MFGDGTFLSFLPDPAWCHHCGRITLCEHLRDQATIRQELRDLDDRNSEYSKTLLKRVPSGFAERWRLKLEAELRHVYLRTLAPSCMHCSHRKVAYFAKDTWAPHPGTGEDVRFFCSGMCSTDFAKKFYDLECHPLQLTPDERGELWESVRQSRVL